MLTLNQDGGLRQPWQREGYNPAMDDAAIEQALRTFFGSQAPEVIAAYLVRERRPRHLPYHERRRRGHPARAAAGGRIRRPTLDLEGDLERLLGMPAQVVILNRAPADLVHRVLRDGKLLVDRNPSVRIAFEVRARNEFFDLKPVLDRYRAVRGPEPVTDRELIAKKLALIETCVQQLRQLARPAAIATDIREERFVEHTLQIAIQAALDVASQSSDERLGEPRTNRELFDLLERQAWAGPEQAATMRRMVGFRNLLVHGYEIVDVRIVVEIVEHRLDDLLGFVAAIRTRLG